MDDDFDVHRFIRGELPDFEDLVLVPETDPALSMRIPPFDFENDPRDPLAIRDLLVHAMLKFGGIGISANQVGMQIRAFAMVRDRAAIVLFNPVISELSPTTVQTEEGCLSFPNLHLRVTRPDCCRVNYTDHRGDRQSIVLNGIEGVVAMHETDHLNGVTFTNKVSRLHLKMQREKMRKRARK